MAGDVLSVEDDPQPGEPLIRQVMQAGRPIGPAPPLAQARTRAAQELERLPPALRSLTPGASYPVTVADALVQLAAEVDRRLESQQGARK